MPRPAGPIAAAALARTAAAAAACRLARQARQCGACACHWRGIGASSLPPARSAGSCGAARCPRRGHRHGAAAQPRGWWAHLLEAAEAFGMDGRLVHEDLLAAVVGRDEPEALLCVEPLHLRARAALRRPAPTPACGPRRGGKLSSPNRHCPQRPWRPPAPPLSAPRRRRAQLGAAGPRLPPRAAWPARRASRRGERGPGRGDRPRGRRRDPGGERTLPIFFASAIAHGSYTDAGKERGLECTPMPRQQTHPQSARVRSGAAQRTMAAPEAMLDVADSSSFSFPAEVRPAAAQTLRRAAAAAAHARRAAGGAHFGVLGRDQGV